MRPRAHDSPWSVRIARTLGGLSPPSVVAGSFGAFSIWVGHPTAQCCAAGFQCMGGLKPTGISPRILFLATTIVCLTSDYIFALGYHDKVSDYVPNFQQRALLAQAFAPPTHEEPPHPAERYLGNSSTPLDGGARSLSTAGHAPQRQLAAGNLSDNVGSVCNGTVLRVLQAMGGQGGYLLSAVRVAGLCEGQAAEATAFSTRAAKIPAGGARDSMGGTGLATPAFGGLTEKTSFSAGAPQIQGQGWRQQQGEGGGGDNPAGPAAKASPSAGDGSCPRESTRSGLQQFGRQRGAAPSTHTAFGASKSGCAPGGSEEVGSTSADNADKARKPHSTQVSRDAHRGQAQPRATRAAAREAALLETGRERTPRQQPLLNVHLSPKHQDGCESQDPWANIAPPRPPSAKPSSEGPPKEGTGASKPSVALLPFGKAHSVA